MRVLLDYRPALRERTGVGEYAHELAKALAHDLSASAGDALTLFTNSWRDRAASTLASEMPSARIVDVTFPVRALMWSWNRLEWPPIEWLAGTHDVVHSQNPLLIPSRAAQVVTVHDLDFLRHPDRMPAEIGRDYPRLVRSHASRADGVIVSSNYAAAEVTRELHVTHERVHVCSPGAPEWSGGVRQRRHARERNGIDTHILFIGTMSKRKNIGTLLDAYTRLRHEVPDAPPLVLAGHRTPDSAAWERQCAEPPLRNHVRVTGYITIEQRIALYERAQMLVLPSYDEGFGLPVLEAMACGVPVVVSSRGSLPEVAGNAAVPIDPDDVGAFTSAMRALLDEGAAAAAAARGLAQASRYSWTACASAARAAYAAALEVHANRG